MVDAIPSIEPVFQLTRNLLFKMIEIIGCHARSWAREIVSGESIP